MRNTISSSSRTLRLGAMQPYLPRMRGSPAAAPDPVYTHQQNPLLHCCALAVTHMPTTGSPAAESASTKITSLLSA